MSPTTPGVIWISTNMCYLLLYANNIRMYDHDYPSWNYLQCRLNRAQHDTFRSMKIFFSFREIRELDVLI